MNLESLSYRVVLFVILCLAILVEHRLVTDRRTQGHSIYLTNIALHGKNCDLNDTCTFI